MDSRLKELREKIVLVDALIHEDDCESKDVHSTRCKASGEVLGLFDALFPAALAAPEPAPGEGSPSPSRPSQDSQEVRTALEIILRGVVGRNWCETCKEYDPECGCAPEVNERLISRATEEILALSQSPKGAAGAGRECWVKFDKDGHARQMEPYLGHWHKAKEWTRMIEAAAPSPTTAGDALSGSVADGGATGLGVTSKEPYAPKTGLRGAPRRKDALSCGAKSSNGHQCQFPKGHASDHYAEGETFSVQWVQAPGDVGEAGGDKA